ncbi:MAG: hypothetical protein H6656_17075 [Ardenticatenaceae bacterium]|nr:hypothetical protein [Ardenticatenaceae bacterium]
MPDPNTSQQETQDSFTYDAASWPHGIIRQLLCNAYDAEELKTLAQDLSVSVDLDGTEGRTKYAREMVDMCRRRGILGQLLGLVARQRPNKYTLYKRSLTGGNEENRLVHVNFVVVAMTQAEAKQLLDEPQKYARSGFQEFAGIPEYVVDLPTHYKTERDKWEPHSCPESSIIQIIEDTFMRLQPQMIRSVNNSEQMIILEPRFYSQDFLTDTTLWSNLKNTGCIVIVDTVSLFHKDVWEAFIQTGISQSDRNTVSMLMLAPINLASHPVHKLITNMVRENLKKGFRKFAEEWNLSFEFGNADKVFLQRWISAMLHRFAEQTLGAMDEESGHLMERQIQVNGAIGSLVLRRRPR